MHLNELSMHNFKKYRRAEVKFQDGLTGIVGSNGTGKSTIVEAIAWALYGNRASSIKKEYIRNARCGESEQVEVKLSLSLGRRELEIYRAMRGKGLMSDAFLLLDGRRIAAGSREVDQRLEEILKISFQDFMKTFYARQKDLDNLLKEGGTGKREYLLKLLGLDDIRERALEAIKADRASLEVQRSRLEGAVEEIGNVDARLYQLKGDISGARSELAGVEQRESELVGAAERRRQELEDQKKSQRSCELLVERISQLQSSSLEKKKIIETEERRLEEIAASRRLLEDLEPKLGRLEAASARLEVLEPRRREHEALSRLAAASKARLDGAERMLLEDEKRCLSLRKARSSLEETTHLEEEFVRLQADLLRLEAQRETHMELQSLLKGEKIRQNGLEASLSRAESEIAELCRAKCRWEEISPLRQDHIRMQAELEEERLQKDLQRQRDDLAGRKESLEGRKARLESSASEIQRRLEALGDLALQEAGLRDRDRELDRLAADLNNGQIELGGALKVQEKAKSEAIKNLAMMKSLGAAGACPTCERPLEGQRDLLIRKYELSASEANGSIAELQAKAKAQREKVDDVAKLRSSLKNAFEGLQNRKSKRSALLADMRSLGAQVSEISFEIADLACQMEALGDVKFDPSRLAEIEALLERLAPAAEECQGLAVRLEELPKKEAEREALMKERGSLSAGCRDLESRIAALDYVESDYIKAKKSLSDLKPEHDRFLSLSMRIQELPDLENKIVLQKKEVQSLALSLEEQSKALERLGFDPAEHEGLLLERKSLTGAAEEAQKIRLRLAAEPEIVKRLQEATKAEAGLKEERGQAEEQLTILGYSDEAHEKARASLAKAESDLDGVRGEIASTKIRLGILEGELSRARGEATRKKDYEKDLSVACRRMEVVDAARSLLNRFMDQVLIRVKNDIARAAGDILEEVSGKYGQIKIDDDFNILVEDGGEFYPITRYSGGEIDMIAVSVRVAISEYLMRFGPEGEGYSFLILDEVFGSQDLEHREKMIQMLRGLEERFPQIIAISHITDVQGQFDNTIQVAEDEMGDSRVDLF